MTALKTGLPLLAAIASFALPSAAMAEGLIPPGNSAATQYTEAFPTAGGQQQAGTGNHRGSRSPGKVLGARNTKRLDAQGAQGRAAAEVAAATAPSTSATTSRGATRGGRSANGNAGTPANHADGSGSLVSEPSGSSGLNEVITQATGASSSGELGLMLPLLIVGAVAWSLAYLLRQRKRPTA